MNKKTKINFVSMILVVVLAGALGYFTLIKNPTPPELTEDEALELVKSTWGDCTQDTCSRVLVSVSKSESVIYVTATYEGLRDDSVASGRRVAVATYKDGKWVLGESTNTQRCHLGRGHQDFSSEKCI